MSDFRRILYENKMIILAYHFKKEAGHCHEQGEPKLYAKNKDTTCFYYYIDRDKDIYKEFYKSIQEEIPNWKQVFKDQDIYK